MSVKLGQAPLTMPPPPRSSAMHRHGQDLGHTGGRTYTRHQLRLPPPLHRPTSANRDPPLPHGRPCRRPLSNPIFGAVINSNFSVCHTSPSPTIGRHVSSRFPPRPPLTPTPTTQRSSFVWLPPSAEHLPPPPPRQPPSRVFPCRLAPPPEHYQPAATDPPLHKPAIHALRV